MYFEREMFCSLYNLNDTNVVLEIILKKIVAIKNNEIAI